MLVGLQTHFDGRVDLDTLRHVRSLNFRMARIDAQASSVDLMLEMVADAKTSDLEPLVIVSSTEQIRALPPGTHAEWLNERNIMLGSVPAMHPDEYNHGFREAADVANIYGVQLWGPVIANLNVDGFKFLEALLPLPPNVNVSVHRYPANDLLGNPSAMAPHKRFANREAEYDRLMALIGDRPYGISETGFPTSHYMDYGVVVDLIEDQISRGVLDSLGVKKRITEEMAAKALRVDLAWWAARPKPPEYVIVYQLNDGTDLESISQYGIRAQDGHWKQAAYVAQQEIEMLEIHDALKRSEAIDHPTKPGYKTSPHPDNDGTVLAIEARDPATGKRSIGKRPKGTSGPWETWRDDGTKAVFDEAPGGVAAILLVD